MTSKIGSLSKNTRKMKFMMRGLGEEAKKELDDHQSLLSISEQWEHSVVVPTMTPKTNRVQAHNDWSLIYDMRYGRMSFGGYNKKLEKELSAMENEEKAADNSDSGADVDDRDMAEHYQAMRLGGTNRKSTGGNSETTLQRQLPSNLGASGGIKREGSNMNSYNGTTPPPKRPHLQSTTTGAKAPRFLKPSY